MKLLDATLWGIVLLLFGAISLTPRQHAPPSAPADPVSLLAQAAPGDGGASALRSPRDRRGRALDPQTVTRCLEVMRDIDPARAQALERTRAQQSDGAFAEALSDKRFLLSLAALKDRDPGLYRIRIDELHLDADIDRLVAQLIEARRASSATAADLQDHLHGLVAQKVAFSLASRGKYFAELRNQVQALEDELIHDAQPANFQPAVERLFKETLERVEAAAARAPGAE